MPKTTVCFIDPPHTYLMQQRTQAPLGIMYMAAVLEELGYTVCISRPLDGVPEHWSDEIPVCDLYCVSTTSLGYAVAAEIARHLKRTRPGCGVVIGGYHVTCEPTQTAADTVDGARLWDAICIGEGEHAIVDIVNDFANGCLKPRYKHASTPDIDALPFPARHLIPEQGGNIFNYDKHYTENGLSTVILSSRGCPFTCNFCATAAMWGRKVRYRSGPSMIAEIQHCIDTFGIREFRFSDELFTVNKKRTRELMDYFATVDIHWKCSTRVDCVDRKTLEAMKRGGCREIAFGVESADPVVLACIDKNTKVAEIERALRLCDEVGIETRVLMMIGTPGERLETPEINIEFLERMPYTCASLAVFMPLPGSPSWNFPERHGIEILSRDLNKYNIYLWNKGAPDFNRNDDVVRILSLPSVEAQVDNQRRMVAYFMETGKGNEISKVKETLAAFGR